MSKPLIRVKTIWSMKRYTLLEKLLMSYHLIKCYYYDLRGQLTKNKYNQRQYDACYLNHWLKYKLIFYKPE
jgi:hypothetical protein